MKPGKRRLLDRDGAEAAAEKREAHSRRAFPKVEHPFFPYVEAAASGTVQVRLTGDWRQNTQSLVAIASSGSCRDLAHR